MLLTSQSDFSGYTVGEKAQTLQQLKKSGYLVPEFVVLPAEYLEHIEAHHVFADITSTVPSDLYAVRSAAAEEDTQKSAQAGVFCTRLAVTPQGLLEAIHEVLSDAYLKITTTEKKFSIIVQEFIEPDFAGVLFTRNPLGGREMVLEYIKGRGEQVVSGKNSTAVSLFEDTPLQELPFIQALKERGRAIEKQFNWPQDIEWAYADGQLYILQSRPITTLTETQYAESLYLEKVLPQSRFYYEQTNTTESFSRPSPLALSLLELLHSDTGPIQKAYAELGIMYIPQTQFITIGNQLYVDKQAETKTLFPALGFVKRTSQKPKLESLKGLWITLRNTLKFSFSSTRLESIDYPSLVQLLKSGSTTEASLDKTVSTLLQQYKTIFNINISAQIALKRFEAAAGSPQKARKLIDAASHTLNLSLYKTDIKTPLQGNSLSIDDTSPFTAKNVDAQHTQSADALTFKEKALLPKAIHLNNWLTLRELGRWTTVKLISDIRNSIPELNESRENTQLPLSHFASLQELLSDLPEKAVLEKRRKEFEELDRFHFPARLASYQIESDASVAVLSPGKATGKLCRLENIDSIEGKKILFVDMLTPELTRYFPNIEAIVCSNGGLLSHLAIMAREAKLPIVRDSTAQRLLGSNVEIADSADLSVRVAH